MLLVSSSPEIHSKSGSSVGGKLNGELKGLFASNGLLPTNATVLRSVSLRGVRWWLILRSVFPRLK
jgi:hypothetical protein